MIRNKRCANQLDFLGGKMQLGNIIVLYKFESRKNS